MSVVIVLQHFINTMTQMTKTTAIALWLDLHISTDHTAEVLLQD